MEGGGFRGTEEILAESKKEDMISETSKRSWPRSAWSYAEEKRLERSSHRYV
jgi:hypothetical protein